MNGNDPKGTIENYLKSTVDANSSDLPSNFAIDSMPDNAKQSFFADYSQARNMVPSPRFRGLDESSTLSPRQTQLGLNEISAAAAGNWISTRLLDSIQNMATEAVDTETVDPNAFFAAKENELKSTDEGRYIWYSRFMRGQYDDISSPKRLMAAVTDDIARYRYAKTLANATTLPQKAAALTTSFLDPLPLVAGGGAAGLAAKAGLAGFVGAGLLRTEIGAAAYSLTNEAVLQAQDANRTGGDALDAMISDLTAGAVLHGLGKTLTLKKTPQVAEIAETVQQPKGGLKIDFKGTPAEAEAFKTASISDPSGKEAFFHLVKGPRGVTEFMAKEMDRLAAEHPELQKVNLPGGSVYDNISRRTQTLAESGVPLETARKQAFNEVMARENEFIRPVQSTEDIEFALRQINEDLRRRDIGVEPIFTGIDGNVKVSFEAQPQFVTVERPTNVAGPGIFEPTTVLQDLKSGFFKKLGRTGPWGMIEEGVENVFEGIIKRSGILENTRFGKRLRSFFGEQRKVELQDRAANFERDAITTLAEEGSTVVPVDADVAAKKISKAIVKYLMPLTKLAGGTAITIAGYNYLTTPSKTPIDQSEGVDQPIPQIVEVLESPEFFQQIYSVVNSMPMTSQKESLMKEAEIIFEHGKALPQTIRQWNMRALKALGDGFKRTAIEEIGLGNTVGQVLDNAVKAYETLTPAAEQSYELFKNLSDEKIDELVLAIDRSYAVAASLPFDDPRQQMIVFGRLVQNQTGDNNVWPKAFAHLYKPFRYVNKANASGVDGMGADRIAAMNLGVVAAIARKAAVQAKSKQDTSIDTDWIRQAIEDDSIRSVIELNILDRADELTKGEDRGSGVYLPEDNKTLAMLAGTSAELAARNTPEDSERVFKVLPVNEFLRLKKVQSILHRNTRTGDINI